MANEHDLGRSLEAYRMVAKWTPAANQMRVMERSFHFEMMFEYLHFGNGTNYGQTSISPWSIKMEGRMEFKSIDILRRYAESNQKETQADS